MLAEPIAEIQRDEDKGGRLLADIRDGVTTREQIERLEEHLFGLQQVGIPAKHKFAPGMYMREIRIPADTLMTGRVHRFEHVSIMVSGEMTTLVDGMMRRISGYQPFIAPAGTKRIGYAHTEVVWLTVHLNPDELRDPDQIEDVLCEPLTLAQAKCRLERKEAQLEIKVSA